MINLLFPISCHLFYPLLLVIGSSMAEYKQRHRPGRLSITAWEHVPASCGAFHIPCEQSSICFSNRHSSKLMRLHILSRLVLILPPCEKDQTRFSALSRLLICDLSIDYYYLMKGMGISITDKASLDASVVSVLFNFYNSLLLSSQPASNGHGRACAIDYCRKILPPMRQ